jgi:hypothetical protein
MIPVVLHIYNYPVIGVSLIQGLVQRADVAVPVVGILAIRVGVVNE